MPENPRLSSLGMNGILSERSGGLSRHILAWSKVMPVYARGLKPRSLDRGVVHSIFSSKQLDSSVRTSKMELIEGEAGEERTGARPQSLERER